MKEYSQVVIIYRDGISYFDNYFARQYKTFTNYDFDGYMNRNIVVYSEYKIDSYGMATKTCRYFFYYNNQLFKVWYLLPQIRMPRLDEVLNSLISRYGRFNDNTFFGEERFYFWNNNPSLHIEYYMDGYTGSIIYINPGVDVLFKKKTIDNNSF